MSTPSEQIPDFDSFVSSRAAAPPETRARAASPNPRLPPVDSRLDSFVQNVIGEASKRTGYTYKFGEGSRTPEEQAEKVAHHVSWTYDSAHMHGRGRDVLAYDSAGNYITRGDHPAYAALGEVYGELAPSAPARIKWGVVRDGRQVDPGHFQLEDDDGDAHPAARPDAASQPPDFDSFAASRNVPDFDSFTEQRSRGDGEEVISTNARNVVEAAPTLAPLPQRQTFDPATYEGRQSRDIRNNEERADGARLRVSVVVPDLNAEGSTLIHDAYKTAALARGVPAEYFDSWQEAHNPNGYYLHGGDGTEHTIADFVGGPDYDPKTKAMRVNIDARHLSEIVDAYKASRGAFTKLNDWASSDETSAGEKVLDAAGAIARPAGVVADYVSRPFRAGSSAFWTGLKTRSPSDTYGAALKSLKGEDPGDAAKNPLAEGVRSNQTLAAINPRLPMLLGGVVETVADPANLIPLGVVGKLAKGGRLASAARSVGLLERGLVEARPLGLLEEASTLGRSLDGLQTGARETAALEGRLSSVLEVTRKLKAGEALTPEEAALYAEVRAKHAPNLPEHFDSELQAADGRRLAHSSQTNEVVDLSTGEVIDHDAARQSMQTFAGRTIPELVERHPRTVDKLPELLKRSEARAASFEAEAANASHPQEYRALAAEAAARAHEDSDTLRGVMRSVDEYRAGASAPEARPVIPYDEPEPHELPDVEHTPDAPDVPPAPDAPPPKSLIRRAGAAIIDASNLPKAVMSSFDMSAPLRQGVVFTLTEPGSALRAGRQMLRSVTKKGFAAVRDEMLAHPDYDLAKESGLYLGSLTNGEELFSSKLAKHIPGVPMSERTFEGYLDPLRLDVFSKYSKELTARGLTPQANPEEFGAIARFINVSTGRGELGRLEKLAPYLNTGLFSPRLAASRFQVLNPVRYARMPPAARAIALRKMLQFAGASGALLLGSHLAGNKAGIDPRESNFGTIALGKTHIDVTGGNALTLKFLTQFARSTYSKDSKSPAEVVAHYLRSKLSPAASLAADAATGETFDGKPFRWDASAVTRFAPLFAQDLEDAMKAEGWIGAAHASPSFFGAGASTYDDDKKERRAQPR